MSIELSPGIKEPLCGYQWVWQHQHDLNGWVPRLEIVTPTSKHTVNIKDLSLTGKVIKELTK